MRSPWTTALLESDSSSAFACKGTQSEKPIETSRLRITARGPRPGWSEIAKGIEPKGWIRSRNFFQTNPQNSREIRSDAGIAG
jgi:hypothetical protein